MERRSKIFEKHTLMCVVFMLLCVGINKLGAAPTIINHWNSMTGDAIEFNANVNDLIIFKVEADQGIDTWHWFLNGNEQGFFDGVNEGKTTWYLSDSASDFRIWAKGDDNNYTDTVKVYGENVSGVTQTVTWTMIIAPQRGNIYGTVTDTLNNPLQGVTISIRGYSTSTYASGNYTLANIPEDTYLLVAHKDGYIWEAKQIEVKTNQTTTCNIQLSTFNPAAISYNGSNIIIENGDATLTAINDALSNPALLEKLSEKEWLLKVPVVVKGPKVGLYITNSDCNSLKMKGIPPPAVSIQVEDEGLVLIDSVTILGWNTTSNTDIVVTDVSPVIVSQNYELGPYNTLNARNSYFKHAYIYFSYAKTFDIVDNCIFYESNPHCISSNRSLYKTIIHNKFIHCYGTSYWESNYVSTLPFVEYFSKTNFSYNYASGRPGLAMGDNCVVGGSSTVMGNELIYGGWNLIEIGSETICRGNILHDNGGNHNGFNPGGLDDRYFFNNYCYNFPAYTAFYTQLCTYPWCDPDSFPRQNYIINSKAENCSGGFWFYGGYDSYIYNFTSDNAWNGFANAGTGNNYVRKSSFINALQNPYIAFGIADYNPTQYGYFEDATFIDVVFKNNYLDMTVNLEGVDQIINFINTYKDENGDKLPPSVSLSYAGELREYVYLDVLVRYSDNSPIQGATVTVENLTDTVYSAISLTLPAPPTDLESLPASPLPLPSVKNLTSMPTDFDGHTPLPNYGWSPNPESTIALMFQKRISSGTTSGYSYKITAEKDGVKDSIVGVNPDTLWYRVKPDSYPGVPEKGTITITLPVGISEDSGENLPKAYVIFQNYPNPFHSTTQIKYALPKQTKVELSIYNVLGEKVTVLVNELQSPGYYEVYWDGKDFRSQECSMGIYFCRFKVGDYSEIKKLLLVR